MDDIDFKLILCCDVQICWNWNREEEIEHPKLMKLMAIFCSGVQFLLHVEPTRLETVIRQLNIVLC